MPVVMASMHLHLLIAPHVPPAVGSPNNSQAVCSVQPRLSTMSASVPSDRADSPPLPSSWACTEAVLLRARSSLLPCCSRSTSTSPASIVSLLAHRMIPRLFLMQTLGGCVGMHRTFASACTSGRLPHQQCRPREQGIRSSS